MARAKIVDMNDIGAQKGVLVEAIKAVGEASSGYSNRGAVLKQQTAQMIGTFGEGGVAAVLETFTGFVTEYIAANKRPNRRPEFKTRTDDPICAEWDRNYKLRLQNPLIQMNGALEECKTGKVIRLSNEGVTKIEAAKEKGASESTPEQFKKLLGRLPWSAAAARECEAALKKWNAEGIEAASKVQISLSLPEQPTITAPAQAVSAPTQAEASATGQPTLADLVNLLKAKGVL